MSFRLKKKCNRSEKKFSIFLSIHYKMDYKAFPEVY